jgi:hypothetical protein
MLKLTFVQQINGQDLYSLLDHYRCLPRSLANSPLACDAIAAQTRTWTIDTDKESVLLGLEHYSGEPGVMSLRLFTLQREVNQHEEHLRELARVFHDGWFHKACLHRVEAVIPASRVGARRCLKWLGFQQETYHGQGRQGCRKAMDFGKGPEDCLVFGLLEEDPKPWESHTPISVEVANG